MKKNRKLIMPISLLLLLVMLFSTVGAPTVAAVEVATESSSESSGYLGSSPFINLVDGITLDNTSYFDSSVVQQLPDGISNSETITLIIETKSITLLDAYEASDTSLSFGEFSATEEAKSIIAEIKAEKEALLERFDDAYIIYDEGNEYNALLSGFEITVKAKFYDEIQTAVGDDGYVILSDEYSVAETQYVENTVNVYETGIFDSSSFPYDGTGMLIAVLDTGIDYYHTAFGSFNVSEDELGLTFDELSAKISATTAASIQQGLTASDVFISNKIPFAFDYADYDSEVFPLRSDHGTHVSGIIAGKDDTITGVAPNAQLVEMKIFSDVMDTARSSWILTALEDCVKLGVDVINLSIGTSCGFSTPSEKERLSGVYDKIREQGISLVVAASNSFNSGYGSEKNGNLDLTSNPDSGTIGSPSTYDGAFCVASVDGDKTSYLLNNGNIIYFNESTTKGGDEKDFVEELIAKIGDGKTSVELEFVKVPGVGRSTDYLSVDVKGKIALVQRGDTTFEDKALQAAEAGAVGIIVYNNVSGDILMNVGTVDIPACSLSKDDGKALAAQKTGTITLGLDQAAGPFMSNFSAWGPSPSLELKPEITAHGGSILSAVPGQDYDRISGTSMAAPNISGVVALMRQYIKATFPELAENTKENNVEVTAMINRLLMSTADIIINKNGLAYSPRKQGAGLANLINAASTGAYILTYKDNNYASDPMDKSKIELGDDPQKTGVYTLVFTVDNFGTSTVSYNISTYVMTEGVSSTKTDRGDTTVSQDGYLLEGCGIDISQISGGVLNGNNITVAAGEQATVQITITLTDENKKYLDESFENGMYVEGFVTLDAVSEDTVDLSVPYLAFYGDWTQAPIFDIDYYETNKDEFNDRLDAIDKTLPDAYATRPIGGISSDYVGYLGSYYYDQKPGTDKISADRNHISISNQEDSINSLRFVWAGLLRGAAKVEITITDDSTGNVIFRTVDEYVRKSYSDGGVSIYPANIEIEFDAKEYNLNNNTTYTVTLTSYLDYGDGGIDTNLNNTFTFPLVSDFSAPTITDCQFSVEPEYKNGKFVKNRLYADIGIYDNHYSMAGYVGYAQTLDGTLTFVGFDQYFTPINSSFNSTTYIRYDLTDYIEELKQNADNKNTFCIGLYDYALNTAMYEIALPDEYTDIYFDTSSFSDVSYLLRGSTYDITDIYPDLTADSVASIAVANKSFESFFTISGSKITVNSSATNLSICKLTVKLTDGTTRTLNVAISSNKSSEQIEAIKTVILSENQTFKLNPLVYPDTEWGELLTFTSSSSTNSVKYTKIVGREVLALKKGKDTVTAMDVTGKSTSFPVLVLGSGDDGYVKYSKPVVQTLEMTGYTTNSAFYFLNSDDREIGKAGDYRKFVNNTYTLSMYPSESVTLDLSFIPYYDNAIVKFTSSRSNATVDENGKVVAVSKGSANITATVWLDGEETNYTANVKITIKDPYNSSGPTLTNYYGNGGVVEIPETLCLTDIGQFAFSNYDYIAKEEWEITEEDTDLTKIWYIGDEREDDSKITKIIIPEGVERIGMYAFANLTGLTEVVLPSTLKSISNGAFYGCTNLVSIKHTDPARDPENPKAEYTNGLKYVKFINREAFANCNIMGEINLESAIAVSDYAFAKDSTMGSDAHLLTSVIFGAGTRSIASYAFAGNTALKSVTVNAAEKIKLGKYAFQGCKSLESISINASVIPAGAFSGCTSLESVTIGKDVAVIGEYAFASTKVSSFTVDPENSTFYPVTDQPYLVSKDGTELLLVAPNATVIDTSSTPGITSIKDGAFSGNTKITKIEIEGVTKVGSYAFAGCTSLSEIKLGKLTEIGEFAFYKTKIKALPKFDSTLTSIGSYAFASTSLESVSIPDGITLGSYAFAECSSLKTVVIGNDVTIGDYAFFTDINSSANRVTASVNIGSQTYYYYVFKSPLKELTIGENAKILEGAFLGSAELTKVELGDGAYIGDYAFFHNDKLDTIDLSGAVYIGNWAFTGAYAYYYSSGNGSGSLEGPIANAAYTDYIRIYYTPNFKHVDLSSAEYIGTEAFAFCGYIGEINRGESGGLQSVILGDKLTDKKIGDYAFDSCEGLASINLENVETIGDGAFYNTSLGDLDLGSAKVIGDYAFSYSSSITKVILSENISNIGANAFSYCSALASVDNLGYASYIGDAAFAYTAITSADLTNAVYVGSYAFCKTDSESTSSSVFTLTLGDKIENMGDNPFANCNIAPIFTVVEEQFGNNIHKSNSYTFDLGDNIKIIDGSLYLTVPNGLMLISYFGNDMNVTVAEGTVRISSSAFRNAKRLKNVTLPHSLLAIGDQAFFGCDALSSVTFKSYKAPILEEEYDVMYTYDDANIPYIMYATNTTGSGEIVKTEYGMQIRDYTHLSLDATNFFFGANFKDYIGRVYDRLTGTDNRITMIRPANGLNYETFILSEYFDVSIDGSNAANEATLNAIEAISKIPNNVKLEHKSIVEEARAAYDKIESNDLRSIVIDYYDTLVAAEKRIANLEALEIPSTPTEPSTPAEPSTPSDTVVTPDDTASSVGTAAITDENKGGLSTGLVILIAVIAIAVGAGAGAGAVVLINNKKNRLN